MEYVLAFLVIISVVYFYKVNRDELTALYLLLVIMPYSVVFVYLFDDTFDWAGASYDHYRSAAFDENIMQSVFFVGVLSLAAAVAAKYFVEKYIVRGYGNKLKFAYLSGAQYSIGVLIIYLSASLYLGSLSARSYNIFLYSYGEQYDPPSSGGAYLIGYTIILLAILRNYVPGNGSSIGKAVLFSAIIYELIFHQLLVGSRESIGLVVAIFVAIKYKLIASGRRDELKKLYAVAGVAVILFLALGAFRSLLSINPEAVLDSGILSVFNNNPWNATLLSVLGYVHQLSISDQMIYFDYYAQLLLKFMPSFITDHYFYDLIDFQLSDPGHWYYQYTGGGAYLPIIHFRSFGYFLGFISLTIFFVAIFSVKRLMYSRNVYMQLLSLVLIVVSFRVMWYGDIDLLRGIQAWGLVVLADLTIMTAQKTYKHRRKRYIW